MLKIRLQRIGRKNDPSFRVVCVDSRRGPKVGKHTELLGSYDPKRDHIAIKSERVKHWISNGAQVSDTMHNLLIKEGIIKGKKIHVAKEKKKADLPAQAGEEKPKEDVVVEETKKDLSAARLPDGQEASAEAEESKEPEAVEEQKEQEVAPEKKEVV